MLDGIKAGFKSLFAKDSTPQTRKKDISLDLITSDLDHIPEGALAALYELLDSRSPVMRDRIRESRAAMNGEGRAKMAPEWDLQDRADFDAGGPEPFIRPRELARKLSSKQVRTKRPPSKIGPTAQTKSTRIEQWDNAILDDQFADYETVEMLLNESMTLWIGLPAPAHYAKTPTLYDEFEEEDTYVDQNAYDQVPEKRRREYERANPSEDAPKYKRMRKQYRLNAKGEQDDGSEDFEVDLKRSAKNFEEYLHDKYARTCPILMRGPISRLDFVPINPRFSGRQTIVDGVIIRTLYRRSTLAREYVWGNGAEGALEPVDRYDGTDGDFYLYELWAYDENQCPFVAYQVGKHATAYRYGTPSDKSSTAVVRFDEEYPGLTELPIIVEYGQHTADSNADKRGLPFPYPYIRNWRQRDWILTALCISIAQSGYPTWIQELNEESLRVLERLPGEMADRLEFRMAPGLVQFSVGKLVEVTSRGTNANVEMVMRALDAFNERDLPSKGAFGQEGPTSGLDRQIIGKDTEVAFGDVLEGYRRCKEAMGRYALMIGTAMARAGGRPIELYAIGTAPNPATGGTTATQTRLTLTEDLCDDNWDVVAQYETVPGERLAQSSLFLEALSQGAILLREWREWGVGDQNPEQFMWEKMLEDFYLKDPAGRLMVYRGMLDHVADTKTRQVFELAHQGEITDSQGGAPTALMQDMMGGQQGMGQMGTGVPANTGMTPGYNPGQAALAAGNGAALRADAAASESPMAGGMPIA